MKHIILRRHYGCCGVLATLADWSGLPLGNWLAHVRAAYRAHKDELDGAPSEEVRWRRLCELNVMAQATPCAKLRLSSTRGEMTSGDGHGWIYDLRKALLRDFDLNLQFAIYDEICLADRLFTARI